MMRWHLWRYADDEQFSFTSEEMALNALVILGALFGTEAVRAYSLHYEDLDSSWSCEKHHYELEAHVKATLTNCTRRGALDRAGDAAAAQRRRG